MPVDCSKADTMEREVVIMMTDMVSYSRTTATMSPCEIRNFLLEYHSEIFEIINTEDSAPVDIEPSAGDGSLIIFDKKEGEGLTEVCNRAVAAAIRMTEAINQEGLPATRMGLILGDIIEVKVGERQTKFGASFSVANRLEELCGYFGCSFLIDREVARHQNCVDEYLVNIGKVSVESMRHPMNIYTVYKPGLRNWPIDSEKELQKFIALKNSAMDVFSGNLITGILPHFPKVRDQLLDAQVFYTKHIGFEDIATTQVLKYIGENPDPDDDFKTSGMRMMEKKRDGFGERILHMSCSFLKAYDHELYNILIEDTEWERAFRLEWGKANEVIVAFGDMADGVYYIDSGFVQVVNSDGAELSRLGPGAVFGEIAYLDEMYRRTATVRADTDVVLRKISTVDLERFPAITRIFEKIAHKRIEKKKVAGLL